MNTLWQASPADPCNPILMAWTSLCELDELKEGLGRYVEIDGFQLAVFLHKGRPHVIDNTCPHVGANLAGGEIREGCVVCPMHEWEFELDTGRLRDSPRVLITSYPVRLLERDNQPPLVQADLPIY